MFKRNFLVILALLGSVIIHAQKRQNVEYLSNFDEAPLRWGFYLGLNLNDYNISYKPTDEFSNVFIETEPKMGFNIGLIGDFRLHKNISLRLEPGLMTNTKTLYFKHIQNAVDSTREASGTFLHVPLLLQFNANRLNNIRPFVAAGIAYDYNFASNFNNPDDNASGEFRMTKNNFMYEVGVGMDFYFYYFKFTPSVRGIFAINKELVNDNDPDSQWTKPVDFFGTRGIFINFTFQ